MIQEIGFWDYTCPEHGSLERYSAADWTALADDMAAGGFTSFVLCVKWLTTGYRSRLPWLDQDERCTAIATNNELIHHARREIKRRGLRLWLLVVATEYRLTNFGIPPAQTATIFRDFAAYDPDQPGVAERILALCEEVVELFGAEADGLIIEMEYCDGEAPHRLPLYEAWAAENQRPEFGRLKEIALEPRCYPFAHWRDFTTDRRIAMLRRIEDTVRGRGFPGRLATICEVDNMDGALVRNLNLARLRAALPDWTLVTYDSIYDRRVNRLATMDFCVAQPRQLGFQVAFLTRGVMTFGANWSDRADSLEEQWRMSLEDAARHQPDILWFMGSDARLDGLVCSAAKLPAWGFADGRTARLRLMQMAREYLR
ncbi:MAG: hypothetical protein N3A66_05640 [Planctomycetota bacterium]|nr:hypothetical protein [Planctomycetota bacterium]